jgi:TorA maturation chaperone TorD
MREERVMPAKHRAGVYALLAEALAPPLEAKGQAAAPEEQHIWGHQMAACLTAMGNPLTLPALLLHPEMTPAALADDYFHSFFLPQGRKIWLVESIYKPWTLDESAEVPFRGQTGWLGGDAAAHMKDILDNLGVKLPPELAGTPDHLAIELELMSWLAENAGPDVQATYLAQHLDWLPLLVEHARQAGLSGFHLSLLEFVAAFVAWDRHRLDPEGKEPGFTGYYSETKAASPGD